MSVTFPQSPTNGQQVTDPATGAIWVWNNSPAPGRWTPVGAGVISNLIDQRSQGFVNKIRNPGMAVWQRAWPITIAPIGPITYTADGWIVSPAGVACTVIPVALRLGISNACMQITAATAGMTDCYIANRMENYDVAPLAGQVCTLQFRIRNSTSAPITPRVDTYFPNAMDDWTNATIDVSTPFQSVPVNPNGSTLVACTFAVSPSAVNGYQVTIYFGNALAATTSAIAVTDVDLRVTPGVPLGLNNNPPRVELRPFALEVVHCQRYYETAPINSTIFNSYVTSGTSFYLGVPFKVIKRINPTMTFGTALGLGFPNITPTQNNISMAGFVAQLTANSTQATGYYMFDWAANAEL